MQEFGVEGSQSRYTPDLPAVLGNCACTAFELAETLLEPVLEPAARIYQARCGEQASVVVLHATCCPNQRAQKQIGAVTFILLAHSCETILCISVHVGEKDRSSS